MVKNNYSSGRNDDRLQHPNAKNESQVFAEDGEEGEKARDVMKCHPYSAIGNMNLNNMLIENIRSHDYFKGLAELKTFDEVVDQIYYDCSYVSPWRPGTHKAQRAAGMCSGLRGVSNAGIPSTCYMLLFKLYCLQITTNQIKRLITHKDSPYIRVIGFLYLRYVCEPKSLWSWYEAYVDDSEKFAELGEGGGETTVGRFIRKLMTELEYHDTMLPRLPVPVQREMQQKLDELDAESGVATAGGGGKWETRRDDRPGRSDDRAIRDDKPARDDRAPRDDRDDDRHASHRYKDLDTPSDAAVHELRMDRYHDRRDYDRRDFDRKDDRKDERGHDWRRDGSRDETRIYDRRTSDYDRRAEHDKRAERRDYGRVDGRDGPAQGELALHHRDERRGVHGDDSRHFDRREPAADSSTAKRLRTAADRPEAVPASSRSEPPKREETPAERLARLRAKQAERSGATGLYGGRIGGDYAGSSGASQPARGIARYQQMMRDSRR